MRQGGRRARGAKSPSDFASLVTSPLREEAFSRAKPAQKAPHAVGSWPSLRGLRGFAALSISSRLTPRPAPQKKRPTLCSVGRNFYATLQITCTGRPAWSDARNGHRRQPGSSRTEPWRDPGRRGPDGCNESRWPGSPDTWTYRRPWRSG